MKRHPRILSPTLGAFGLLAAALPGVAAEAQDLETIGRMLLPSEDNALLQLDLRGEKEVRAGQEYRYQVDVTNISQVPLYQVKVHQTIGGNFSVDQTEPKADPPSREARGERRAQRIEHLMKRGQADGKPKDASDKSKPEASTAGNDARPQAPQTKKTEDEKRANSKTAQNRGDKTMNSRNWTIGQLAAGATETIKITGVAPSEGNLDVCTYATFVPAMCATVQVTKLELALTRQFVDADGNPEDLFFVCDTFGVHYVVTNEGTGRIDRATVTEKLPEGLTTADGAEEVSFEVGPLDTGESASEMIALTGDRAGTYRSGAHAEAGSLMAKSDTQSVELIRPELELDVTGPSEQYLNRTVEYTFTVTNASDAAPAFDTEVVVPGLDEELRLVANDRTISPEVERFALGTINPGEARSFTVAFERDEPGEVATKVTAEAYCAQAVTKELATNLKGIPAVQVMVVDAKDPVAVGDTTTYEIKVWNEGTAKDVNLQLKGQLPDGAEFVEAYGDTEVTADGNTLQFAQVNELAPGASAAWTVQVRGKEAGRVKLKTTLTSDSVTKGVVSSEPTTIY